MNKSIKQWAYYTLALGTLVGFPSCQSGEEVVICSNSVPKARIVIAAQPSEVERYSSVVLQDYLHQITGANYEIVSDEVAPQANDIHIGKVNRPELKEVNFDELEDDGYVIMTENNRLTIAGGKRKGTLYGVFGFLEKFLGCRKYTSTCSVVPPQFNISLKDVDVKEVPVFKYREILYRDAYDQEFFEWHALGRHNNTSFAKGEWGSWCHTSTSLVPPKEYAASHPEYYSMVNGKRKFSTTGENKGDVCWSHPDVYQIMAKNLKKWIDANPQAKYWSVSQRDNADFCRCPVCMKAYEEQGSKQGTILPVMNKLAKQFPDKMISTLAYWYSTQPPKDIKVEKNVNIMLCNIGSPRHIPIEKGDSTFTAHLKQWNQIHDNFIIWDYVIQFANLVAPFPNLRTLQPNLQFLHENGVKAMFEQGNREKGGEFCELRAYVLAKLLWNPYQDVEAIIDDFVYGYYGPAGKFIREYINLMHDTMEATHAKLNIFGRPWDNKDTFLTEAMIEKYYGLIHRAEEAVQYYPEFLRRVLRVRTQIDYAVLDIAEKEVKGPRGAMEMKDGKLVIKKEIEELLNATMRRCHSEGVTRIHEWTTTPLEYIGEYHKYLEEHSK